MVIKIFIIGMVGVIASLILKQTKPELATLTAISTGIIIFYVILQKLAEIINNFLNLSNIAGFDSSIIALLLKVVGISYIIEFGADIDEDSGFSSIASKIVLAGKVIIIGLAFPIVLKLIELIKDLL